MKITYFLTGFICFILSIAPIIEAVYAVMSIDLGDQYLKIGIVKPGVPMETVLNREFRRKTVNMIGIRKGERYFSDAAANLNVKYPINTYGYIMDLIGKQYNDTAIKIYKKRFPYIKLLADKKRNTVVVETDSGKYNVETLLGMILWNANEITNIYAGQKVNNAIITVPSYYTQYEREAIEVAAEIAGIKLLKIINEASAIGLNYGVFRMNEINETKHNMLIYDVGASKTSAVIIEYQKFINETSKQSYPVVKTLGFGYDRNLGGLKLTFRLRDYLVNQFNRYFLTSSNITESPRSMAKMLKEAERVKQVLSANTKHKAQVENVFEDKDFKAEIAREEFLYHISDLDDKWTKPIDKALEMAGLKLEEIDKFVLFGGGTRVPKILEILTKYLNGKEIGRFLNTDESASLGALYYGAYLAKGFQVKKFEIEEKNDVVEKLSEKYKIEKMSDEDIKASKAILKDYEKKEYEKAERDAAHNSLESTVYTTKDLLENSEFTKYATDDELSKIRETVEEVYLWLEDEVTSDTTSSDFIDKSKIIDYSLNPIKFRQKEHYERPKKIKSIEKILNETTKFIEIGKNLTDILSEDDIKTLQDAYDDTLNWWTVTSNALVDIPLNKDAPVTNIEIIEKAKELKRKWKVLENKMKNIIAEKLKAQAEKEAAEKKIVEEAAKKLAEEEKNKKEAENENDSENKTILNDEIANQETSDNANDSQRKETDVGDDETKSHIPEEL
ncbi:Hypoxia up-regulated protein 1 [Strongyloides ratti]|uniref:Hypoxia up-regulated protein 1 n=1 Tax=Strongyloides ratti TaxID=34506 RepID=A0A090MPA0_STRRB|nr:Hypoxia up-regulated protein 1 [Strongyloides ratti]CEF59926.1 Hypoxia up-regulated protein 1 [Strongyloides ratti]